MATTKKQKKKKTVKKDSVTVRAKLGTMRPLIHRERIIQVVVGGKDSGKTFQTKEVIKKYHKKFPTEKILIVDFYNEYNEYPIIDIDDIIKFTNSKVTQPRRVVVVNNGNIVEKIVRNYRGGLLVMEQDIYIDKTKNDMSLIGLVLCNRTKDIDVILHYTTIKQVPIKVYQNASYFRLHRSIEAVDLKKLINDNSIYTSTALCLGLYIQSNAGDNYSSIYVDMNRSRIIGATNEQLFDASANYHRKMLTEFANMYKG